MTTRRKPGRPRVLDSVYHAGMCRRVIEVGKRGGTTTGMALACGVSPAQLRRWRRRHREFACAFEMAKVYAQAWWEKLGAAHLEDPKFNHNLWLRIMQQRFEQPDRHLRFKVRKPAPSPVAAVAEMIITRTVSRSAASAAE